MQARLMSQALRKLSHSLSLSQTTLIFINQVRAKLSTFGYGGPSEVTCGGNALKFYASVRLNVRRIGLVKKGDETIGSQVQVKVVKNKGISREAEILGLAVKHKFVTKAGSFYGYNGQSIQGKEGFKQFLAENENVREELMTKLREKLVNTQEEKEIVPPKSSDEEAAATA